MGLLSGIQNFASGIGLLSHHPDQGYNSPSIGFQPAAPVAPPAGRGQQFALLLQDIGAGLQGGPGGRVAAYRKQRDDKALAAAHEARIADLAVRSGLSPQELLSMELNREAFGKSLGTNSEAANVGGGDTRVLRGGAYTAPKMSVEGGFGITQTPGSTTITGQRPKSYSEAETETYHQAELALRRLGMNQEADRLAETIRHNKQTESLGWSVFGERKRQGGFGTPGVGSTGAMGPDSDWEDVN